MTIITLLGVVALACALILYALRQNINLFFTPGDVVGGAVPLQQVVRIGGVVVPGSVKREHTLVEFRLADAHGQVVVHYQGILPDLFREGQSIVALGRLDAAHHFQATEVLAKHDETYMPAEVYQALHPQQGSP